MKRFTILLGALMLTVSVFAQVNDKNGEVNMMSKRGEYILPVEGDFAIGINALPIIGYFGNLFNGTSNNNASWGFATYFQNMPQTIYGKYYLTDKSAIRAGLQVGINNNTYRENVTMNQEIPDPKVVVTDVYKKTTTQLGIGADYLMYRGKGRLQGYYGGGLYVNYTTTKEDFTYGNLMTTEFSAPYYYDFKANNPAPTSGSSRTLSIRDAYNFGFTVRGVVGIEYFVAPKISIGGEFCLGVYGGFETKGIETKEYWTGTERVVETNPDPKNASDLRGGIRNASSGSLFMMFHF
ncbi:MAG: hypothetical protein J6S84_00360 [Bacteroidales bacterium]|nr:hypothetical protein [Bacteroidales bacterium]